MCTCPHSAAYEPPSLTAVRLTVLTTEPVVYRYMMVPSFFVRYSSPFLKNYHLLAACRGQPVMFTYTSFQNITTCFGHVCEMFIISRSWLQLAGFQPYTLPNLKKFSPGISEIS